MPMRHPSFPDDPGGVMMLQEPYREPWDSSVKALVQVERLLACSFRGGKPSQAAKQEMEAALKMGRASLKQPIAAENKGSILLKQMGWSEGLGLGRDMQGRTEPVPLHLGQRRRGLGN